MYCFFPVVPPTSLPLQGGATQRKKLSAPRISLSLDQSEDDLGETPDDLDINVDDLDTPDEGDYLDYTDHEMDWEGGLFMVLVLFMLHNGAIRSVISDTCAFSFYAESKCLL